MKRILFILFLIYYNCCSAQDSILYVAAKSGLSLRETSSVSGKLISKLDYGTKLIVDSYAVDSGIFKIEGFDSEWVKVFVNGKKGYVASAFLFPIPPPANNTKSIKSYLDQVSKQACTVNYGEQNVNAEEKYDARSKTLYKNGAEVATQEGYEWGSITYVLPGFNIQSAFHLLRLIPEFDQFVRSNTEFQTKSRKTSEVEVEVVRKKECDGFAIYCIEKIRFYSEKEVISELQIFEQNGEIYILYNSGV